MDKRIYLGIILFILSILSCGKILKPEIPDSQNLIIFSLIKSEKPIIASISKSYYILEKDRKVAYVDSCLVELYEDDQLIDTLERIDSFFYYSDIVARQGHKYRFRVKDTEMQEITTKNVEVLSKPKIHNIRIDSIYEIKKTSQDFIEVSASFDTIKGYDYMAYNANAYSKNKRGNRWKTSKQHQCSDDELAGIDDVSLAYIGCLDEIYDLKFSTSNYHFEDIDSVQVKICKVSNFTGGYINSSVLTGLVILAPDDNISTNVSGGYGAITTMSCSTETIKLK